MSRLLSRLVHAALRGLAAWALPLALVAAWEAASLAGLLPARVLPAPSDVAIAFWQNLRNGILIDAAAISSERALLGLAIGGGIIVDTAGSLVLKPTLGAKKGSKQASATDVITSNTALAGGTAVLGAAAGVGGSGQPPGANGTATGGEHGEVLSTMNSEGGGMAIFGTAHGDNVSFARNHAITDPNIDGTLLP